MHYRENLNAWAIARLLPNNEWETVARFRSWSDAEGHLKRLPPTRSGHVKVVFDPLSNHAPEADAVVH
ncbi:MAG TPA: hypothetical protein V6C88_00960 [Chroococcidiopsis sp.]